MSEEIGEKGKEAQAANNNARSLFVEFRLETPLLRHVCQKVPEVTVHLKQELAVDDTETVLTIRVLGEEPGALEAFEAALADDDTVKNVERFGVGSESKRRYQLRVQREYSPYWKWAEQGMVLLEATRHRTEWRYRMRLRDRATLAEFVEYCRNRGWEFGLIQIRESFHEAAERGRYGMSQRQRNLIDTALEQGYFEVPREVTLVQLAEEMGISDQAASERLRRGLKNHFETTVSSSSLGKSGSSGVFPGQHNV